MNSHSESKPSTPTQRTWTAGCSQPVPADLTGVRWRDGSVECRFRLLHPAGSLVAVEGDVGVVLTNLDAECTTCSEACTS
ncbi:MAG: hypothetical protein Q7V57_01120 [Actinomycetota bacterium]|nr:hypothetical protein [Actinomycetota bacterium]